MKVNLFVLGAMKCGTTTLYSYLKNHPEVSFSYPKETGFFLEENWHNQIGTYHKKFKIQNTDIKYYAEGDTNYTKHGIGSNLEIWNRIYKYNPNAKFIYLYRNPIDRIISEYTHFVLEGYQKGKIEDLIFEHSNYINNSSYFTQLIPFVNKFGRENFLIIEFEEFIKNRVEVLNKISNFLDINKFDNDLNEKHLNKSLGKLRFHYKWRFVAYHINKILDYLPKKLSLAIMKFLIPKERQLFEKPVLSKEIKDRIMKILNEEINKIKEL